jgi:WD40 repeat protein
MVSFNFGLDFREENAILAHCLHQYSTHSKVDTMNDKKRASPTSSDGVHSRTRSKKPKQRVPQLPTTLWIEHVLPLLDRVSFNNLCSTYRELYEASRNVTPPWPTKSFQVGAHVNSVAFSPDGGMLASGSEAGIVRVWHRADGRCTALEGHTAPIPSIAFSPDGNLLASVSDDRTIRLWKLEDHSCRVLEGHAQLLMAIAFSPDGAFLASGDGGGEIRLWDINSGTCIRTLQDTRRNLLFCVTFSPDGGTLVSGGEFGFGCGGAFRAS